MNANKISAICADILAERRTEMTMSFEQFKFCEAMYERIMQAVRYQAVCGDYRHIDDGRIVRFSGEVKLNLSANEPMILGSPIFREQFIQYTLARLKADNFVPNDVAVDAEEVMYRLTVSLLP